MRHTSMWRRRAVLLVLTALSGSANAQVFGSCQGDDPDSKRIRIDQRSLTVQGPFYNVPTGKTLSYPVEVEKTGHLSWGGKTFGCDFDPVRKTGSCGGMMMDSFTFKCEALVGRLTESQIRQLQKSAAALQAYEDELRAYQKKLSR